MKLNKAGRNELRKRINMKLSDVDFNPDQRIKLPLDVLEDLLFDYSEDKKRKKFAFSSDHICKLDLSEVSFENVSFNSPFNFSLKDSNAKIDFKKTFEYLDEGIIKIKNISFENVDLSNNDFESIETSFENCSLNNTNLKTNSSNNISFVSCSLKNNNFKKMVLFINESSSTNSLIFENRSGISFINCDLSNTKINISLPSKLTDDSKEFLNYLISKGYLNECFVNGKKILSIEEKNSSKNELVRQYNKYKSEYINNTIYLIETQVSNYGGRQTSSKKKILSENE